MFGFIEDAWDSAVDVVEDGWDAATDAVEAGWDAAGDAAGRGWGAATDAVGSAGGGLGSAIAWGADAVDTATFGFAGAVVDAADDYVFDSVDYVTGGLVDIDFDDGAFSVGLGFDGMASLGVSVGEHGISADGSLPGVELGLALTEDGVSIDGQAGIDYGPLPYVEGHLEVAADGEVSVNGQIQGTIPTPVGLLSGSVEGGFAETADGFGAYIDADGTLRMPSGTTITAGLEASYVETATGSHTTFAAEGAVSMVGMGSVGGGVAYERLEEGGDVVEAFHAEAAAQGFGMSASAEADYAATDIDGVQQSDWSGSAQFDAPGDAFDLSTDAVGDGAGAAAAGVGAIGTSAGADDGLDPFAATAGGPSVDGFDDLDPVGESGFDGGLAGGTGGDGFDDGYGAAPVDGGGEAFVEVAAPVEPVSDFDQAIDSADQVEGSMDDMFEEI